jgi:DNA-binding LytR/AlgR family response regulator
VLVIPLPFVARTLFIPLRGDCEMWKPVLPRPRPSAQRKMNLQNEYDVTQQNTRGMHRWPLQDGCADRLVVRRGQRISSISLKEVDWISSARNYVELHVQDEVLKSRSTLEEVAALVRAQRFLRINRRTVVNLERVEMVNAISNCAIRIRLRGGACLSVSRRYSPRVRNVLEKLGNL